jgi:predicted  nucleic acid-binding Zn-ribbon protein
MRTINKIEDQQIRNEFENLYKHLNNLTQAIKEIKETIVKLQQEIKKTGGNVNG